MFFQGPEGVVELAIIAAFVAAEEVAVTVGIAQGVECAQGMGGRIFSGVGFALTARFVGEAGGFE